MDVHKPGFIRLRGVRQNNLKNLDLDMPLGKLIVVTGLSGTGKSSLVFDTLHAEGQRRYVETFSPYTRQFLELLDRPDVDSIENIPPSIAIEQTNTVKSSRSTVGTMTELCDFFKVWFCQASELIDPPTGERIEDDSPASICEKAFESFRGEPLIIAFRIQRPPNLSLEEVFSNLDRQGYTRIAGLDGGVRKIGQEAVPNSPDEDSAMDAFFVVQDRVTLNEENRKRFLEALETALHFGKGEVFLLDRHGREKARFSEGLKSPVTGKKYRAPTPALFSFNSPLGACPKCRGFGRSIEIDYDLAIPDSRLSLLDGAIRPFQGKVYGRCQEELLEFARRRGIRVDLPFEELSEDQKKEVIEGDPTTGTEEFEPWFGLKGFFEWLESKTYKMHVRIFLSRYRAYRTCRACGGDRLQPESLCWQWNGHTLPQLYRLPVGALLQLVKEKHRPAEDRHVDLAFDSILTRLGYLDQIGLGYLTLDRPSRTLSGGEVERVNLTSCLGTSLVQTLFVLDEPSVGLHSRDINRLIDLLRLLTDRGNTVVLVEHDETMIRAADIVLELGPEAGSRGGHVVFHGNQEELKDNTESLTGAYLHGRKTIASPALRRPAGDASGAPSPSPDLSCAPNHGEWVRFQKIRKHNLHDLDCAIPLGRFVCLSGVSGSGKSTLLNNGIYQGILARQGKATEDPAVIEEIDGFETVGEVVLADQSPVSRTPRSNAALYTGVWTEIRELFAKTEGALAAGLTPSFFSFNSGSGRCETCEGLGYEKVEMQFLSDAYVTCEICDGKRFRRNILAITLRGKSIADVLEMTVDDALLFFGENPKIRSKLESLESVGLGYLPLGQPLNTLSGGESQRLKLVKYLTHFGQAAGHTLLLLDEPTTGLHRHDVKRLIGVLQALVDKGHSLVVIEHHVDVLKSADWLIEIGPEAGAGGGKIVAAGTPEHVATVPSATREYLVEALAGNTGTAPRAPSEGSPIPPERVSAHAQELQIVGAREHNLKNLSLAIPHKKISVITGVSGSGKSTLAFDIVFAEGQRRFLESMSAYARQFVEQLPRPAIDRLDGIPPTVAIEQRVTRGNRKSTVATVTEVAPYLRLLFARAGVQHSPHSGHAVVASTPEAIDKRMQALLRDPRNLAAKNLYLCAPLVRGRKGHHRPIATWIADHGFEWMRVDGKVIPVSAFQNLDRYREHSIEVVVADLAGPARKSLSDRLEDALRLGKGACFLLRESGEILSWFSTSRMDPHTGEAYPELDPKDFSFNSARGWCPACRGYGTRESETNQEDFEGPPEAPDPPDDSGRGSVCSSCNGDRLNPVSRAVRLYFEDDSSASLPELLQQNAEQLLHRLRALKLDRRGQAITKDILPQIEERLRFLDEVGLDYLDLDRSAQTLSGGEAQRIRLAAQLGSNLSGVLYVLDEPSIGLHARDNQRLIESLLRLRDKGNTLLVVEHDEDTMRQADLIIDLGPGAGLHGGRLLALDTLEGLRNHPESLTGQYLREGMAHPLGGAYRKLPPKQGGRRTYSECDWLILKKPELRNLKGDDLRIPIGRLTMVCGVSGAGKSTLIRDLLDPLVRLAVARKQPRLKGADLDDIENGPFRTGSPALFAELINGDRFRKVIEVDQRPIGKTPRSTPATYLGAFDIIRAFFASLPEAKMRGHSASRFSFNTSGGRCESCKGAGRNKFEMNFLPNTYLPCEACGGRRYGDELLDIRWRGMSIADVLEMTFEEAAAFFDFHSTLGDMAQLMVDTGLGYLTLGQSSPTLSGGEAQRLKLASELVRGNPTVTQKRHGISVRNLYILEEPTIGLHFSDCRKLIQVLHRLVDQGHTVIVIEHNTDLLAEADYLVEVGPDGGEAGGEILYQGKVEGILKKATSPTAPFLKEKLGSVSGPVI